jgi:hypothetical protein
VSSVLAPIEPHAYKEGHADFYGAVEVERHSGAVVWRFDSTAELRIGGLFDTSRGVKYKGFRPSSVARLDDGLTLISEWKSVVWVDEDGSVVRREQHDLMNEVHEVERTDRGTFLVASTGLDTVVEFDEDWNVLWRWHMWEHVDPATRPGNYYPPAVVGQSVREIAFSPDERYHLNYVTELDPETLLCSARLYGVFTIDKATGEVRETITDCEESHNPVAVDDDVVLCESGRDRVVSTDMESVTGVLFEGGLDFVKDADPMGGGDWLVTDTKNDRVLVWTRDEPEPAEEYELPTRSKPYEADYLTGSDSFA